MVLSSTYFPHHNELFYICMNKIKGLVRPWQTASNVLVTNVLALNWKGKANATSAIIVLRKLRPVVCGAKNTNASNLNQEGWRERINLLPPLFIPRGNWLLALWFYPKKNVAQSTIIANMTITLIAISFHVSGWSSIGIVLFIFYFPSLLDCLYYTSS